MKRIVFVISLAMALAFCLASSGTWALHNQPVTPSVLVTPAASAAVAPVICGGSCDWGEMICDHEFRRSDGVWCMWTIFPGYPYAGWAWSS
jgi:hypothetical protein